MNVECTVPSRLLTRRPIGGDTDVLLLREVEVARVDRGQPDAEKVELSVPDSLLERRTGVIDDGARYGVFVEYWVSGERVHRSEATFWEKGKVFTGPRYSNPGFADLVDDEGMIHADFNDGRGHVLIPVAGLLVKKFEDDGPEQYVVAIEFYEPGREQHVHRSVHVSKKTAPSMTGDQGRML